MFGDWPQTQIIIIVQTQSMFSIRIKPINHSNERANSIILVLVMHKSIHLHVIWSENWGTVGVTCCGWIASGPLTGWVLKWLENFTQIRSWSGKNTVWNDRKHYLKTHNAYFISRTGYSVTSQKLHERRFDSEHQKRKICSAYQSSLLLLQQCWP